MTAPWADRAPEGDGEVLVLGARLRFLEAVEQAARDYRDADGPGWRDAPKPLDEAKRALFNLLDTGEDPGVYGSKRPYAVPAGRLAGLEAVERAGREAKWVCVGFTRYGSPPVGRWRAARAALFALLDDAPEGVAS